MSPCLTPFLMGISHLPGPDSNGGLLLETVEKYCAEQTVSSSPSLRKRSRKRIGTGLIVLGKNSDIRLATCQSP